MSRVMSSLHCGAIALLQELVTETETESSVFFQMLLAHGRQGKQKLTSFILYCLEFKLILAGVRVIQRNLTG